MDRDHSKDNPGRDRIADGPVRYSISDSHFSDRIKDKCHVLFFPS